MLLDHLYVAKSVELSPGRVDAKLCLDPQHPIFRGHFPGAPVLPGVCMMHIVKEMLEKAAGSPLLLEEATYAKFLSMINPLETDQIDVHIEYSQLEDRRYEVMASLQAGSRTCLKYKALFQPAELSD